MQRFVREPLVHFLVLGALIFFVFSAVTEQAVDENEIYVSRGQQENLVNTFARTWQRLPTPGEYQGLLRDYIRQEIAYRQSREMGLDENDIVIRRRLRQKMEMLAEDVAALVPPTNEELQSYLETHPDEFAIEPRFGLYQLYFSVDLRGEDAHDDARRTLDAIGPGLPDEDTLALGDPLSLPVVLEDSSPSDLGRLFGEAFAGSVAELEPGSWQGPVQSGFGWHLVYVFEVEPGRQPTLDEVRSQVELEVKTLRRKASIDSLYERLAENYRIEIEPLLPGDENGAAGQ